jgi:hypothetical protein
VHRLVSTFALSGFPIDPRTAVQSLQSEFPDVPEDEFVEDAPRRRRGSPRPHLRRFLLVSNLARLNDPAVCARPSQARPSRVSMSEAPNLRGLSAAGEITEYDESRLAEAGRTTSDRFFRPQRCKVSDLSG